MTFILPETIPVPNERRIEAIKKLRRGSGLKREAKWVDLDMFNVEEFSKIVAVVRSIVTLFPFVGELRAIGNALAVVPFGSGRDIFNNTNLTDRREVTADQLSMSLRTVVRMEDSGAVILDSYFEMLADPDHPKRYEIEMMSHAAGLIGRIMIRDED